MRAFDRLMPAFGDALSADEIGRVVDYMRGFCTDRAWPRGELNLPRALVTEKAFPGERGARDDDVGGATPRSTNALLYEHRLGARSQFEVAVPFAVQQGRRGPLEPRARRHRRRVQARALPQPRRGTI